MGFGSIKYDVEEKGLDPRVPHKVLDVDGRLALMQDAEDVAYFQSQPNASLKGENEPVQPPESATPPEDAIALVQSMFEDESPEAIAAEEARLAELDKYAIEEAEKNAATKLAELEAIAKVDASPLLDPTVDSVEFAKSVLDTAAKGVTEAVSELHNKGIPVVGLDDSGEVVVESAPEEETTIEEEIEKKPAAPKKKTVTKKKTSKK